MFCLIYGPLCKICKIDDKLFATNSFTGKEDSLTGDIVDSAPENYPPILVQSMMKKVVEENRDRRAIVSCDGTIDWNYGQYYQEVQKAAKGFISLGK